MSAKIDFNTLYQSHYVRVFGLCRRLLNSATQAEDATQEAFMRAYKIIDRYDPNQAFWPWIATVANNLCIDMLRRRNKTASIFDDENTELDLLESSNNESLNELIQEENVEVLLQGIDKLSEKYRIPIVMAYLNGASYDEISEVLGISRNHVGILILRAKQQLRELLTTNKGGIQ